MISLHSPSVTLKPAACKVLRRRSRRCSITMRIEIGKDFSLEGDKMYLKEKKVQASTKVTRGRLKSAAGFMFPKR